VSVLQLKGLMPNGLITALSGGKDSGFSGVKYLKQIDEGMPPRPVASTVSEDSK